jgi:hypothetical protein
MAYKQIDTKSTVTFIPNDIDGSVSVLVFYPGVPIAIGIGRKYMPDLIKAGVPDWFDKYVIVIPEKHTTPWSDVLKDYSSEMEARGLKESNLSIGIFSGSGNNSSTITSTLGNLVVENLMLMDPVFSSNIKSSSKKLIEAGSKGYSMYNPKNWKNDPGIAAGQSVIPSIIGAANSVDTRETNYDHEKIPTKFLLRFRDQIEPTLISILKPNSVDDGSAETTTESTGGSKTKEIIPDGVYTFNVVKEGIFVLLSTGTSSGTSSTVSKFGELTLIEEEEGGFIFQDDFDQGGFELDDEFSEGEFEGIEEIPGDSEIDDEVSQASDTFEKTTSYTPSGKYDLDLIPGTYLDNNKNSIELCAINGQLVNVKIAEQYLQMRDAAKTAGINLTISSAFRSPYDTINTKSKSGAPVSASSQQTLYNKYLAGTGNLAAKPGYSNHGSGIGLDLNAGGTSKKRFSGVNKDIYIWLVKNSWKFGFVRAVNSEEWHFDYLPDHAKLGPYGKLNGGNPQKDTNSVKTKFYAQYGLDNLQGPDWGSTINIT